MQSPIDPCKESFSQILLKKMCLKTSIFKFFLLKGKETVKFYPNLGGAQLCINCQSNTEVSAVF